MSYDKFNLAALALAVGITIEVNGALSQREKEKREITGNNICVDTIVFRNRTNEPQLIFGQHR